MALNPFGNINWYGMLMAIVIGFGFLGSAPVNERRMRNSRWGMLAAVLAGPVSNLILAILCAIPFWFGMPGVRPNPTAFLPSLPEIMFRLVLLNLVLCIFNLIPLFPLDGWTILMKLLPPQTAYSLSRYQNESTYVLFGLIILSYIHPTLNIFIIILRPPLNFLLTILIPVQVLRAFFGF